MNLVLMHLAITYIIQLSCLRGGGYIGFLACIQYNLRVVLGVLLLHMLLEYLVGPIWIECTAVIWAATFSGAHYAYRVSIWARRASVSGVPLLL